MCSLCGNISAVLFCVRMVKIKGNGTDAFMIQKFPYQIDRDTIIDFVEFVPEYNYGKIVFNKPVE